MINPALTGFIALGIGLIAGGIVFLISELNGQNNANRGNVMYRSTSSVPSNKFDGSDMFYCMICLDPYGSESNLIKLKCKHKFHGRCIQSLLILADIRPVCPICRYEIDHFTQEKIRNFQ